MEFSEAQIEEIEGLIDRLEDKGLVRRTPDPADGRRHIGEMEKFNLAVEAIGISPEAVHRAFDRYFAETMPGS